jgi:hypothetical protein
MASLLGALLPFFRILRSSAKDHIKRFPRSCWALFLAYLGRKLSKWWCSLFSKLGAHGNTKSTDRSSPGSRGGSCSVSCGSSARGYAARVAASTVPASAANAANQQTCDGAEWQPEFPLPPSLSSATLSADPPWAPSPDLNLRSHWVGERSPTNHQSAGDRPSAISISRSSSRASVQSDRPTRAPRATYRQFGSGASRGRSSRSPSPQPSPISPQVSTGLPSSFPHTREQPSSPIIHRARQRTTSVDLGIQNPSTDSISLSDRWGTAFQPFYTVSQAASSARLNYFILPECRILKLINSDEIPRYKKDITTQVNYFFIATQS